MITRVLEILQKAGYKVLPQPLKIVGVDFQADFPAMLTGPGKQESLVAVLDSSRISVGVAMRRIKALTTTLDRSGSEVPLTVVLITPEPKASMDDDLDAFCRVVRVSSSTDAEVALRPLLPLSLPEATEPLPSAVPALLQVIGPPGQADFETALLEKSKHGQAAVTEALRDKIDTVAREYLQAGGEE